MKIAIDTPPTDYPVKLSQVKNWLRIDENDNTENALISQLISAATEDCSRFLKRTIAQTQYSLYLDAWPTEETIEEMWLSGQWQGPSYSLPVTKNYVELPMPPVQKVDAFNVFDSSDNETPYGGSWYLDTASLVPRLYLASTSSIPLPGRAYNGIRIQYTAGYASGKVPPVLQQAIMVLISYVYEHRGDEDKGVDPVVASGAANIMQRYRIVRV